VKGGATLLESGDMAVKAFSLSDWFPGPELVLNVAHFDSIGWLLNGDRNMDLLERSDLGGNLLKAGQVLGLHTDIQGISGNDNQRLEVLVGSKATSIIDEHRLALVEWIGVVQLDSGVSHVQS